MQESALLQVDSEPNLVDDTFQEVDCGVALQLRLDQEAPGLALQAVAANSCWADIFPVDTPWHAKRDEVEVHSGGCFVKYVEEQAHFLADIG